MTSKLAGEVRVIDADTHMTERHDLFTSRAPAKYAELVPHVVDIDGNPHWVIGEKNYDMGPARAGGVIDSHGRKYAFEEVKDNPIEWVHEGAWNPEARLAVMDECGIYAQVIYPNAVGIGGQHLVYGTDEALRMVCIQIYNDYMAQLQDSSGNRFLPMPILPAWDVDACVKGRNGSPVWAFAAST
jgi:hypothetical protein